MHANKHMTGEMDTVFINAVTRCAKVRVFIWPSKLRSGLYTRLGPHARAANATLVACRAPIVFLKDKESQFVSHKQPKQTSEKLQQCDLPSEAVFAERAPPDKPKIKDGEVARFDEQALVVHCDLQ